MINNQSGLSIVATILTLLMFSLFIAVAVSLVTTGAHIGVQEEQGDQAFYIADGGIQYVLALNRNNIPNYSTHGQWIPLGAGTFRVDTPAYLDSSTVNPGDTTIDVDSTDSFPATGRIIIDSEFIQYTAKDDVADTFTVNAVTATHSVDNSVYPAARLGVPGLGNNCAVPAPPFTINVQDDPSRFSIPGIIFIDTEYFYCTGTTPAPSYSFTGCTRCYLGSLPDTHPANNSYASQYILTSTGLITNFLSNNVQRVVRINAGPWEE